METTIKRLVNIGGIKHTGDPAKDIPNLSKMIEKELDNLRQNLNKTLNTVSTPPVVPVASSGGAAASQSSAFTQPKAGIVAITSVVDTFIPFSGNALSNYVLNAYFLDSTGQFAVIPVVKSDWSSTGFWVRATLLPSVGMIFYMAIPLN